MAEQLNWELVDRTAEELGISAFARKKWRQRGVPHKWWFDIIDRTDGKVSAKALEASRPQEAIA